jgi:hypothetical protein
MADDGSWRPAHIALGAVLPMLLQGCAVIGAISVVDLALNAALVAADVGYVTARESTLQDALASRTFTYPRIVVWPALQQAAHLDGRSQEPGGGWTQGLIVSYAASPSTGGAAGSIAVKAYGRGYVTFSTTVIVLRGPTGSDEVGRKVGEQLLDAMAADLANIERQVATKTVAVDIATVFDALGQVGQRQGRKVLTRDAPSHSLRVSFPFFMEGRSAEGFLDIACVAEGGSTIVTLVGNGKSPALEVRKAATDLLAALTGLLHQPE